jgi:hypothetical protein
VKEESNKELITRFILNQLMKILGEFGVPKHSELERVRKQAGLCSHFTIAQISPLTFARL